MARLVCKSAIVIPISMIYTLGNTTIQSVESYKDLGFLFDNHLKFHHHNYAAKANRILGLIKNHLNPLIPRYISKTI